MTCCMRTGSACTQAGPLGQVELHAHAALGNGLGQHGQRLAQHQVHVHHLGLDAQLAAGDGRDVQQVVDQPRLHGHVAAHQRHQVLVRRRHAGMALQQVHGGRDGRQRRAQFVREHGDEAVLGLAGALGLAPRGLGLLLGLAQRLRGQVLGRGVARDAAPADHGAALAMQRHQHAFGPQARAVAPAHPALGGGALRGGGQAQVAPPGLARVLALGQQQRGVAAHGLAAVEAEHGLGAAVPAGDAVLGIEQQHGVVAQRLDDAGVQAVGLAQARLGAVARGALAHLAQRAVQHQRQPLQPALAHVVGGAALEQFDRVVLADHAGHEDEGQLRRRWGPDDRQRMVAVEAGQLVVGQDEHRSAALARARRRSRPRRAPAMQRASRVRWRCTHGLQSSASNAESSQQQQRAAAHS
ncbi:MAG: hypothetical protein QM777_20820 [Pseudorhodoferax sp.]